MHYSVIQVINQFQHQHQLANKHIIKCNIRLNIVMNVL